MLCGVGGQLCWRLAGNLVHSTELSTRRQIFLCTRGTECAAKRLFLYWAPINVWAAIYWTIYKGLKKLAWRCVTKHGKSSWRWNIVLKWSLSCVLEFTDTNTQALGYWAGCWVAVEDCTGQELLQYMFSKKTVISGSAYVAKWQEHLCADGSNFFSCTTRLNSRISGSYESFCGILSHYFARKNFSSNAIKHKLLQSIFDWSLQVSVSLTQYYG